MTILETSSDGAELLQSDIAQTLQKSKKGFTLTEIAIVLGIIGLILGAIWTAAAAVYNNQRVAHANTAIVQITQGVRALYATSNTTGYAAATLITDTLRSAGAIPADLTASGTANLANGPFPNGQTAVIATSDGAGFGIDMSGVTQANCTALVLAVGGAGRDPGLGTPTVKTTAAPAAGDVTTTPTPLATAYTPATALALCANVTNKIVFPFTIK